MSILGLKVRRDRVRPGGKRKLTGQEQALLVATACSSPPEGRARWTIELLAGEMVRLTDHESISGETVRRRLAENELKPWREKMWCVPKINGAYVARMEAHGGCARSLRRAARSGAPGGVPGREPRSADEISCLSFAGSGGT